MGRATDIRNEMLSIDRGGLDRSVCEELGAASGSWQRARKLGQLLGLAVDPTVLLEDAMDELREPERQLLGLALGLGDEGPRPIEDIAMKFAVDVEDAELMIEAALDNLEQVLCNIVAER